MLAKNSLFGLLLLLLLFGEWKTDRPVGVLVLDSEGLSPFFSGVRCPFERGWSQSKVSSSEKSVEPSSCDMCQS